MRQVSVIKEMSNEELKAFVKEAGEDLEKAAETERNSEWHEACFAAVLMGTMEMNRRGIQMATVH
jgi:hypothetical protein